MQPHEIRKKYLDFFVSKGHFKAESDSLIPGNDPTLLFTTAGMVQFKALWAGAPLEFSRATSVQKCLRAGGKGSDLENVGKTLRHHTFFEMLGNFSFGDYFKEEAIEYALEFVLEILKMDKEKLWVSVFDDDDETEEIWVSKGFPRERIVRLGAEDNFWGPAGDEGACGPCSEIYYDLGEGYSCGSADCAVGCDCERYLEFWNLVFPQFYQEKDGSRKLLERKGVDTGMGLERLSFLMDQQAANNYETAIFKPLIDKIRQDSDKPYEGEWVRSYHVIADHIRALTFALSDGILPSNEGRGYVIRRILRRALRFGRNLGFNKAFLADMAEIVIDNFSCQYPDLQKNKSLIVKMLSQEEKNFIRTLNKGLDALNSIIKESLKDKVIAGDKIFHLYDTLGLPFEVIEEVALENDLGVDKDLFDKLMSEQKAKGKKSWKGTSWTPDDLDLILKNINPTDFKGYELKESEADVLAVIKEGEETDILREGDEGILVFSSSPFYAESGGQVSDKGEIRIGETTASVYNVTKTPRGIFLHEVKVCGGDIKVADLCSLKIDAARRNEIKKHHTATHLLQAALRKILGNHVKQAGSMVAEDRLRFDFSHTQKISAEEISLLEEEINKNIAAGLDVKTEILSLEEAKERDEILANFGEKYGQTVRVVSSGKVSFELCGGTHIENTGLINGFAVTQETSVAAGVRRIEAVTGRAYHKLCLEKSVLLKKLEAALKTKARDLPERIIALQNKIKELEKKKNQQKNSAIKEDLSFKKGDVAIIIKSFQDSDMKDILIEADQLKSSGKSFVALLAGIKEDKCSAVALKSKDQVLDCREILNSFFALTGGKGGGKENMARGGAKDVSMISEALKKIKTELES